MLPLVVLEQADPSINEVNNPVCFTAPGTAAGMDGGIHFAHTIRACPIFFFRRHVPHPAFDTRRMGDATAVRAESQVLLLPPHLLFLANLARVMPVALVLASPCLLSLPARRLLNLSVHRLRRHARPRRWRAMRARRAEFPIELG